MLGAILKAYPMLRRRYLVGKPGGVSEKQMPPATELRHLRSRVELVSLCFHPLKIGRRAPYIGYTFNCGWDDEHGLGVLMGGLRCVEVGEGSTAILQWIAEEDLKKAKRKAKARSKAKVKLKTKAKTKTKRTGSRKR